MAELPVKLRNEIIKVTHGPILERIHFFRDSNLKSDFNEAIIYRLQPFNLMKEELLYQSGDSSENIYFIYEGQFNLFIDLYDYVQEPDLLKDFKHSIS